MEDRFKKISQELFRALQPDESLTLGLQGEESTFTRISQSRIRQTGQVLDVSLSFSFAREGRRVTSSLTLGESEISQALTELHRLRQESSQLPVDPYLVLPAGDATSRAVHKGRLLPARDGAQALLPAMQGVDLAGIWASGNILRGVATSSGQFHWFSTETFSLDYSLVTPEERMVKATFAGREWDQAAYESFMADSISRLEPMHRKPQRIKPGDYRTFIASAGVADLLNMFSWGGISEAAYRQGESALGKLRAGDHDLSPRFRLSEDFSSGLVPRFNELGETAPESLPLIVGGKFSNSLVSSRSAREYQVESNFATEGESLRSPVMGGGDLAEEDVLAVLGTGVYLSNLHYLNWSDRIGGRITGMTRYACFWVEDGEIVAPIENMRFDDSLYRFFGSELKAVTQQTHVNPDVGTYDGRELSAVVCPGILLENFSLTL